MTKEERIRSCNAAYRKVNQEKRRAYSSAYYKANTEKALATQAAYRKANPEKVRGYVADWRKKNQEKILVYAAKYRKANPEKIRALNIAYRKANMDRACAKVAARNARKLQATPLWADSDLIKDIYAEAKYQQMHVDHVVPLRSKNVCGLHWEGNLQLLSPSDNKSKGNRQWPGM